MPSRPRVALVDPTGSSEPLAATLRALGAIVETATTASAIARGIDLAVVTGEIGDREAAHSAARATGCRLVVEVAADAATTEAAFARGADDVVDGVPGRLAAIVRRAALIRPSPQAPLHADALASASDWVVTLDASDVVAFTNRPSRPDAVTVGGNALDLFPGDTREVAKRAFDEARAARAIRTFRARVDERSVEVRVVPLGGGHLALVASDATAVADVLERLNESEARAGAILAAMPDLVFRMTAESVFVDVHAPEDQQLLVPAEEIPGRPVEALLPPDVAAAIIPAVARAVAEQRTEFVTYELEIRGTRLSYEARIVPVGRDQVLALVRNMTEYNQRRERLALTDRLASLGTMAAGVAHEINGPLTFVMLGLEWLEEHVAKLDPPASGARDRLRAVLDGVVRIQRIVRDLKGFTIKDDPEVATDVTQALEGALRLAAGELRYRAKVERRYETVPRVRGSAVRLGQVFSNLVVNAAHSLPEASTASNLVTARTFVADDGRVAVEIADTGRGIAPEHVLHLFEPFFTTKPHGQGTGLGLWICHEIVKDLGGDLVVESELGKGSTFRVLLPALPAELALPPAEASLPPPPPRARILVIDDEPNLAKTLAILLDEHVVEVAIGGAAGIAWLERDRELDLVLCDLMMPDVTGMDVYAEVSARWPSLANRFAFMTGGAFTPRAREFIETCQRPHLEKPFRAESIRALLRSEALRHAEARAHAR